MEKKWMTLNAYGKFTLQAFIYALSGTDITTTQKDYLHKKELIDYASKFNDRDDRSEIAGECLTDLGIETVKHYFPGFKI